MALFVCLDDLELGQVVGAGGLSQKQALNLFLLLVVVLVVCVSANSVDGWKGWFGS